MNKFIPDFRNKNNDPASRFCHWIVSNYGAAKHYARAANVSAAMAEKRRQGVVPTSFINEQAKPTRERGASWFFETFAAELAEFTAQKEAEAHAAREQFENLRQFNQGTSVHNCD